MMQKQHTVVALLQSDISILRKFAQHANANAVSGPKEGKQEEEAPPHCHLSYNSLPEFGSLGAGYAARALANLWPPST